MQCFTIPSMLLFKANQWLALLQGSTDTQLFLLFFSVISQKVLISRNIPTRALSRDLFLFNKTIPCGLERKTRVHSHAHTSTDLHVHKTHTRTQGKDCSLTFLSSWRGVKNNTWDHLCVRVGDSFFFIASLPLSTLHRIRHTFPIDELTTRTGNSLCNAGMEPTRSGFGRQSSDHSVIRGGVRGGGEEPDMGTGRWSELSAECLAL